MSKFNSYAQKVNETAKAAFDEYRKTVAAHIDAEEKVKEYREQAQRQQRRGSVDPQLSAKLARAEANLIEANEAYRKAPAALESHMRDFEAARVDLAAEINDTYVANPKSIEKDTLELLKSGILVGNDYVHLMVDAQRISNHTMVRFIGKYADEAAKERRKQYGDSDEEAKLLAAVAAQSRQDNGSEYLKAFDYMLDVYRRTANNPRMIDHWDELVARVVEEF